MYSPFNIKNPASRNHTAVLHPNQTLKVTFNDITITDECNANIESDLLELESELYGQEGKTFVFKQTHDLEAWSSVSKTFLGHISFSGMGKVNPSIGVFLDSHNQYKKDVITVVNPCNCNIKLYPNQILEVVSYAPIWGQDLKWAFEGDESVMELLASTSIDPTVYRVSDASRRLNDAFYTYPRILQDSRIPYLEYHWWFRCRRQVARIAQQFPDSYPPSVMAFCGTVEGTPRIRQTFRVSLNSRTKPGWENTRIFNVTFEDSALDNGNDDSIHSFALPISRDRNINCNSRHHRKKDRKKHHNQSDSNSWTKWQPKPFQENEVTVRLKPWTGFVSDGRVVSDDPLPSKLPSLPAPASKVNVGWSGRTQYTPPKPVYYYDDGSDQWE